MLVRFLGVFLFMGFFVIRKIMVVGHEQIGVMIIHIDCFLSLFF